VKATESKTTTSNLHHDQQQSTSPFFQKDGEQSFFSDTQPDIQPFFQPNNQQPITNQLSTTNYQLPTNNPFIQAKLKIGQPNDKYEQEADSVADQVVQKLSDDRSSFSESTAINEQPTTNNQQPTTPNIQQKCADCEAEEQLQKMEEPGEEEMVQRKPIFESAEDPPDISPFGGIKGGNLQRKCATCAQEETIQPQRASNTSTATPDLESRLNSSKGGGSPLPEDTRNSMESAMGADFSGVRVHTDSSAVQMNQELGAQAFTHGRDVYFNSGKYNTQSSGGQQLLAHELVHTVQQGETPFKTQRLNKPNFQKYSGNYSSAPNLQAFEFPDIGSAISTGADFISDTASSAVEWAGDRIGEAIEMGADAFMAIVRSVAPGLVDLIQNGPTAMLSRAISQGVQSWFRSIFGEFDLGQFVTQIRTNLSDAFNLIQGILAGDEASCQAFNDAIDAIRSFIGEFMDNPFFQAIQDAFNTVKDFLSDIVDLVVAPVFDAVMEFAGEAFNVVRDIASTVWGWITSVKNYLVAAWDWVMEQLGFTANDEGGVWEWLKGIASDIWQEIKTTFAPVIGPLQVVLGILVAFSPVGPIVIAARYGPQVVEAIQWLWNNRNNPNIVQDAREQMGDSILPQLLSAGETFINQLSSTVSELLGQLVELGSGLLSLAGSLTGIPLLEIARSFVQNISQHVQDFVSWVQTSLQTAVEGMHSAFERIKTVVEPYIEILTSIGLAILNPPMIPIILAGWAWRALPDCYKPPIIDFLLDGVITFLEALPALPFMGPLWLLLKPFILGFLREFRGRTDEEKVAITDKLAKIISGASPEFIFGFVGGFLRGVWEGLTDPFVLLYSAIQGMNNLTNWFLGLFSNESEEQSESSPSSETPPTTGQGGAMSPEMMTGQREQSNGSSPEARQNQASLSGRMGEMGEELSPHVDEVTENFMPAVEEHFQGGEGMTFDDLTSKLGELWTSAQEAISGAGQSLAQRMVEFFMGDSAEREMGDTIGWLSGTIVFEVVLGILTAGTYQPASAVGRALKFFARILDWTGEVLGVAFRMLSRLGGYIMTFLRRLMDMIKNAGGAVSRVLNALREIAQRVIRYAQELLGRLGRGASGEVAEEATERAARETAEEVAEETAERAAREGVEEVTEETAEEVAEETAERGAREGIEETGEQGAKRVDDPEFIKAMAEARLITEVNDLVNTPVNVLIGILTTALKPKYHWIDHFGYETKGLGRYEIILYASKHPIKIYKTNPDGNWRSTQTGDTAKNSKILRGNMEIETGSGLDAHHIVPSTHGKAAEARSALDEYQIDINSPDNGIALSGGAFDPGAVPPSHHGSSFHSHAGIDEVQDRILEAKRAAEDAGMSWGDTRQAILEELDSIRDDILNRRMDFLQNR